MQRLCGAVAHELRNPLNGVALNLEVLRGRVGRKGVEGAALTGFAEAAAADLGHAVRLTDALLAVARPVREPVDLAMAIAPIVTLARAIAVARGGSLEVALPDDLAPALDADGDAVRGAVTGVLLAAIEGGRVIRCRGAYGADAVELDVDVDAGRPSLPEPLAARIAACGIGVRHEPAALALRFPRDGGEAR